MTPYFFPSLLVADRIGLFSQLERGPSTREEVAVRFGLSPRASEALLGILAALGLLVQHQGRFSLTALSRGFLLPHSPYYWGGILREHWEASISAALRKWLLAMKGE